MAWMAYLLDIGSSKCVLFIHVLNNRKLWYPLGTSKKGQTNNNGLQNVLQCTPGLAFESSMGKALQFHAGASGFCSRSLYKLVLGSCFCCLLPQKALYPISVGSSCPAQFCAKISCENLTSQLRMLRFLSRCNQKDNPSGPACEPCLESSEL